MTRSKTFFSGANVLGQHRGAALRCALSVIAIAIQVILVLMIVGRLQE